MYPVCLNLLTLSLKLQGADVWGAKGAKLMRNIRLLQLPVDHLMESSPNISNVCKSMKTRSLLELLFYHRNIFFSHLKWIFKYFRFKCTSWGSRDHLKLRLLWSNKKLLVQVYTAAQITIDQTEQPFKCSWDKLGVKIENSPFHTQNCFHPKVPDL